VSVYERKSERAQKCERAFQCEREQESVSMREMREREQGTAHLGERSRERGRDTVTHISAHTPTHIHKHRPTHTRARVHAQEGRETNEKEETASSHTQARARESENTRH